MDRKKQILKRHILEDVLVHIEANHIIAKQNRLIGLVENSMFMDVVHDKCEELINNQCEVCARGSLIYSFMVRNKNHYKNKDFERSGYNYNENNEVVFNYSSIEKDLIKKELFTERELSILEILFESYIFEHQKKMFSINEQDKLLLYAEDLPGVLYDRLTVIIKAAISCLPVIEVGPICNKLFTLLNMKHL